MKKDYEKQAKACKAVAEACNKRSESYLEQFYRKAAVGFERKAEGRERRTGVIIYKDKQKYKIETTNGQVIYETKDKTEAEKVLAYLREKANQ